MSDAAALSAVVSLVVAVFSAGAAFRQARSVALSNEAEIFLSFSDRYNSSGMRDASPAAMSGLGRQDRRPRVVRAGAERLPGRVLRSPRS